MNSNLRMIVTGGGTGGHFFPAIAIRNALQKMGVEVKYIGSCFGVESTYYEKNSQNALLLNIRGIQRHFTLDAIGKNLLFPIRFLHAYLQSRMLFKEFKPQVVIGTGGYSSGLPLLAAIQLGIKTVIQEQNSYPGITTRKLASRVDSVCIAYNEATNYLKKKIQFSPAILFGKTYN